MLWGKVLWVFFAVVLVRINCRNINVLTYDGTTGACDALNNQQGVVSGQCSSIDFQGSSYYVNINCASSSLSSSWSFALYQYTTFRCVNSSPYLLISGSGSGSGCYVAILSYAEYQYFSVRCDNSGLVLSPSLSPTRAPTYPITSSPSAVPSYQPGLSYTATYTAYRDNCAQAVLSNSTGITSRTYNSGTIPDIGDCSPVPIYVVGSGDGSATNYRGKVHCYDTNTWIAQIYSDQACSASNLLYSSSGTSTGQCLTATVALPVAGVTTFYYSVACSAAFDSKGPTIAPTRAPSRPPTLIPTRLPTTSAPSRVPTYNPTRQPTVTPSAPPSYTSTAIPTLLPTYVPGLSYTASWTSFADNCSVTSNLQSGISQYYSSDSIPDMGNCSSVPVFIDGTLSSLWGKVHCFSVSSWTVEFYDQQCIVESLSARISKNTVGCFSDFVMINGSSIELYYTMQCTEVWKTVSPSALPTVPPSGSPTVNPTVEPSTLPTIIPTAVPTTSSPSPLPSQSPTLSPTQPPTCSPSNAPTLRPSGAPSIVPSPSPSVTPTSARPSISMSPSTLTPTQPSVIYASLSFYLPTATSSASISSVGAPSLRYHARKIEGKWESGPLLRRIGAFSTNSNQGEEKDNSLSEVSDSEVERDHLSQPPELLGEDIEAVDPSGSVEDLSVPEDGFPAEEFFDYADLAAQHRRRLQNSPTFRPTSAPTSNVLTTCALHTNKRAIGTLPMLTKNVCMTSSSLSALTSTALATGANASDAQRILNSVKSVLISCDSFTYQGFVYTWRATIFNQDNCTSSSGSTVQYIGQTVCACAPQFSTSSSAGTGLYSELFLMVDCDITTPYDCIPATTSSGGSKALITTKDLANAQVYIYIGLSCVVLLVMVLACCRQYRRQHMTYMYDTSVVCSEYATVLCTLFVSCTRRMVNCCSVGRGSDSSRTSSRDSSRIAVDDSSQDDNDPQEMENGMGRGRRGTGNGTGSGGGVGGAGGTHATVATSVEMTNRPMVAAVSARAYDELLDSALPVTAVLDSTPQSGTAVVMDQAVVESSVQGSPGGSSLSQLFNRLSSLAPNRSHLDDPVIIDTQYVHIEQPGATETTSVSASVFASPPRRRTRSLQNTSSASESGDGGNLVLESVSSNSISFSAHAAPSLLQQPAPPSNSHNHSNSSSRGHSFASPSRQAGVNARSNERDVLAEDRFLMSLLGADLPQVDGYTEDRLDDDDEDENDDINADYEGEVRLRVPANSGSNRSTHHRSNSNSHRGSHFLPNRSSPFASPSQRLRNHLGDGNVLAPTGSEGSTFGSGASAHNNSSSSIRSSNATASAGNPPASALSSPPSMNASSAGRTSHRRVRNNTREFSLPASSPHSTPVSSPSRPTPARRTTANDHNNNINASGSTNAAQSGAGSPGRPSANRATESPTRSTRRNAPARTPSTATSASMPTLTQNTRR